LEHVSTNSHLTFKFFLSRGIHQNLYPFCKLVLHLKNLIMRKLILAVIAVLGFAFTAQAQDSKTVKTRGAAERSVAKTETKTV
jgi:hypothetical protein